MTATCPPDRELDRLLAEQLSAAEEEGLEAHVAGCAACQTRLDRLTTGRLALSPGRGEDTPGQDETVRPAGLGSSGFLLPGGEVEPGREGGGSPPIGPGSAPTGLRFTVLRSHAEGGLGRVHLAHDEQLHRTVALKDIRPERADDPRTRRRFLNEAEITGQLEHPGVVPVYALERDAAGRPVYAMRFVQGRTLGDAVEAHHRRPTALGLRELLQRFISVCQTVAYAHSKGVIHRDLKPANVMLGDYGETLVVDWGLSKRLGDRDDSFVEGPRMGDPPAGHDLPPEPPSATVLDQRVAPGAGSDQLTVAGQVMGTPAYMAPEQARGEAVSPAADVYALGAVLFSLLTGKMPFQGTSAVEVLRKVAAGNPPDVAGAPRPLNAIYFKAMARDPHARYATAAELARDVERWLADEPVGACREPWPARAGRWARRHRTLVASLGVAAGLLVATSLGAAWWQGRVAQEREYEQARRAEEQRVEHARTGDQVEVLLGRAEAAVAADDAAGARLAVGDAEKRAENPGADPLRERLARCRLAADLLAELDRIDDLRWDPENGKVRGLGRAAGEWPGALARLGVVVGQTPPRDAAGVITASPVRERLLAALDLWLTVAAPQDGAALAQILAAADADPFRDGVRAAAARAEWQRVKTLASEEAALRQPAWFAAALGSIGGIPRERRLAVLGTAARTRPRAFAVLMTAGRAYTINDRATAADRLGWFRAAVAVRPGSCVARTNLGVALRDAGDLDGALAELRVAVALDPGYALAHNNLGVAFRETGDPVGAIAEYRTAIALHPEAFETHVNLGNTLTFQGDLDAAVAAFRKAGGIDPSRPEPSNNLGYVLREKGDFDRAVAAFQEAEKHLPKGVGTLRGETERWIKLMPRADAVAGGRVEPASAVEAADFSRLYRLSFLKRYAASARQYAWACDKDKKYATDPSHAARRYDAARSAALAGCGHGSDAPDAAPARAALRGLARGWLDTNRKHLDGRLATGTAGERRDAAAQLSAWLSERDLAGVRPGAARDGWAPAEVAAWDTFWADVRASVARATGDPRAGPGK